tara:strand:+ start:254 stop:817 length:564 start_codon:yes stop_codon:yes gene_type:complete
MKIIKPSAIALIALTMAACSSTGSSQSGIPEWVLAPQVENGIASTECVESSNNFTVDRNMATSLARASLVQQINLKVQVMDKTYIERVDASGDSVTGGAFSSVSRQIANLSIQGAEMTKSDIVKIGEVPNVCVQVALNPERTQMLLDEIVAQSGRELEMDDQKVLYQEFKAYKAQQELEQALKGSAE